MLVALAIFVIIKIGKELSIFKIVGVVLGIVSPLFIGMIIAWLLMPLVNWLQKKGLRRVMAAFLVYFGIIGLISLLFVLLIPSLYDQINDFTQVIPNIYGSIKNWLDQLFEKLNYQNSIDFMSIKEDLFEQLAQFAEEFTKNLPNIIVNLISRRIC